MRTIFLILFLLTGSILILANDPEAKKSETKTNLFENLKAGEWFEVPNSRLDAVPPGGNVIAPWSGGAFDTKRNQLLVWGGGHGDYAGNEIYAFSLDTMKWVRLTEPSSLKDVKGCNPIMPDGQPTSRHTYNGLEYIESEDRMISAGGFIWPCANGDPFTWFFDFNLNKWEMGANLGFGSRAMVAYDSSTGHLWCFGGSGLNEYDPISKTWTKRNHNGISGQIFTVDPINHWLIGLNKGSVTYFPIAGNKGSAVTHKTSGDVEKINAAMPDGDYCSPGFVWCPITKQVVAWSGGAEVYLLDAEKHVWTKKEPAATNKVTPTKPATQGTYGRFRYSPKSNVFVVVNSIKENVYIYPRESKVLTCYFGSFWAFGLFFAF